MESNESRTLKIIALMLIVLAVSQPIYTALFLGAPEFERQLLWKLESVVFVLLAALCASAAVQKRELTLGFVAIAFSALLKLLAVGLGLTQFDPFYSAAELNTDLGAVAASILALSFFCYNAGNMLLGLAALVFGMDRKREGGRLIGNAAVVIGAVALIANAIVMMFGTEGLLPSPIGGASGVLATLLLAICVFSLRRED